MKSANDAQATPAEEAPKEATPEGEPEAKQEKCLKIKKRKNAQSYDCAFWFCGYVKK